MTDHKVNLNHFEAWLKQLVQRRGSDLHLVPGYKPRAREDGELHEADDLILTDEDTRRIAEGLFGKDYVVVGARKSRDLGNGMLADIFVSTAGGRTCIDVRVHGGAIPSLEDIEAPEALKDILCARAGIVIVAGPFGSGKTTTLYALADWINRNRNVHMCTVENPRWHLFAPAKALVQQHEAGVDGADMPTILHNIMRKDPEVLMVGEVEDLETLATCITAAETGHLVLLHLTAVSVRDAVERLMLCAPPDMQPAVRAQLKNSLRAVMVQRLARRTGKGRVPVYELVVDAAGKLAEGQYLEDSDYVVRAADRIHALEADEVIPPDEVARLRRELNA